MASSLSPVLRLYQFILYPAAKPSALLLDTWFGKESVQFLAGKNIKLFIEKYIEGTDSEIDHIEGRGAINFFSLDDLKAFQEGEEINPDSIIPLDSEGDKLVFSEFESNSGDAFIQQLNKSEEPGIVFPDKTGEPKLALDTDGFLRSELFCNKCEGIEKFCHVPLIYNDKNTTLDVIIKGLRDKSDIDSDKPIEKNIVLLWGKHKKAHYYRCGYFWPATEGAIISLRESIPTQNHFLRLK
jgi:hypothetical protein